MTSFCTERGLASSSNSADRTKHADTRRPAATTRATATRERTCGAAYIEALVMLPVLLVIWAGVYFMYDRYATLQHTQLTARTCAWLWANQACEGTLPPECNHAIHGAGPVDESGEADDPIRKSVNSEGVQKATGDGNSFFDRVIGTILGDGFRTRVTGTVPMPDFLGGGNREVHATEYLICNEKERDLMDVIKGVSCAFGLKFAC